MKGLKALNKLNDTMAYLRASVTLIIISVSILVHAQGEQLNTIATDSYTALRSIVSQADLESDNKNSGFEYRLNEDQKLYIRYFIGANTFTLKSDIDILNRRIYAKLKFSSTIKPYDYERSRIDSLYLMLDEDGAPFQKYLYNLEEDAYGKVIHHGRFLLVELYQLSIRKGKTNPLLDSGSEDDRLIVKKIDYLYDTGKWYKIPKSKNQLIDFVKLHYRKTISKKSIENGSGMRTLEKYN